MEGAILRVEEVRVVSIRECKIDKGGDLHHGSLPTYTRAAPLGRVASVPKIPAGRQSEGPMKWRHVILILAGPAATISRSEYDPFPRAGDNPVLDLIAFHNPALHAAIEAWYYLAPGVAVLLGGVIACPSGAFGSNRIGGGPIEEPFPPGRSPLATRLRRSWWEKCTIRSSHGRPPTLAGWSFPSGASIPVS